MVLSSLSSADEVCFRSFVMHFKPVCRKLEYTSLSAIYPRAADVMVGQPRATVKIL